MGKGRIQKKARVLIAEDNITNQMLYKIMLEDMGISVDIANDGFEAVEMYRDGGYDLILMDIHMPVMNGIESAGKIMEIEKSLKRDGDRIPIIALTADVLSDEKNNAGKAGIVDFFTKPISAEQLYTGLKKYIPMENSKNSNENNSKIELLDNLSKSAAVLGIQKEVLLTLINKFLSNSSQYLDNISLHIKIMDYDNLCKEAHKMKGAALNLRLNTLGETALEMERNARNKIEFDYSNLLETMRTEIASLRLIYSNLEV